MSKPDLEPPAIPVGLVEFLRQVYPDTLPRKVEDISTLQIAKQVGQREVIDLLESHYKQQLERG